MTTPGKSKQTPCDCGSGEVHYRTSHKSCLKRKEEEPPPGAPGIVGNPNESKASYWASGDDFIDALASADCRVELYYRNEKFVRTITSENHDYGSDDSRIDGNNIFGFFNNDERLVKMLRDETVCKLILILCVSFLENY